MNAARERIVETRPEHLSSLVRRLREPEVRRVLEPVIAGTDEPDDLTYADDRSYVRDLGLVAPRPDSTLRIANPVYAEVIDRALTQIVLGSHDGLPAARDFVRPDGRFDMPGMLTELARFWRNHEPMIRNPRPYQEALAHFVFMAWIERAVNGDGQVFRELAAGTGRADVAVYWRYTAPDGRTAVQHEAIEIKTQRPGDTDPLDDAMTQLDGYLNHLSLSSGYIIIFDQRSQARPRTDGLLTTRTSPSGHAVTIARLTVPTTASGRPRGPRRP